MVGDYVSVGERVDQRRADQRKDWWRDGDVEVAAEDSRPELHAGAAVGERRSATAFSHLPTVSAPWR